MTRLFALLLILCALSPVSADAQDRSDWHGTWVAADARDTFRVEIADTLVFKMRKGGESPQTRFNATCLWSAEDQRLRIEACTKVEAWSDLVSREDAYVFTFAANSDDAKDFTDIVSNAIGGARREGPALIYRKDGDTIIYQRQ